MSIQCDTIHQYKGLDIGTCHNMDEPLNNYAEQKSAQKIHSVWCSLYGNLEDSNQSMMT